MVKFLFDTSFLLGAFDKFIDIFGILVEFEVDDVTQAELRILAVNNLTANTVELLPVARLHEL